MDKNKVADEMQEIAQQLSDLATNFDGKLVFVITAFSDGYISMSCSAFEGKHVKQTPIRRHYSPQFGNRWEVDNEDATQEIS